MATRKTSAPRGIPATRAPRSVPPPAPPVVKRPPAVLGRYELGAKIADGGMAEVFLARLTAKAKAGGSLFFAIKVLRPELAKQRDYVHMFMDEAEVHRRIMHPNTVHLFENGEQDGWHYIAMELLCGASLLDVWEACQAHRVRMQPDILGFIGARVAQGLHYAHELADDWGRPKNIVHRDVNPSNIFLTFDGRTKIIDFGFVKAEDRLSQTADGIVKGKVAYLSPEQVDGYTPDRRADIFSLGTTLWEVATDRRLFRRDSDVDTVRAIQECAVVNPKKHAPYLPEAYAAIIMRALERDPNQRYQTAEELAHDLDDAVAEFGYHTDGAAVAQLLYDVCEWGQPGVKRNPE